jgi:cell division protein FtsI/penicillin-binding protein 2
LLLTGMLVNVVEVGHSKPAQIKGYYVAGKTGTAQIPDKVHGGYKVGQWIHTFVGYAPVDNPKFVMLVKVDNPKDAIYAESTAAPLFSELGSFILNYLQVPKER